MGGSNDYIHGRCVCQEPRPHTRLPTRTNPQPSARPALVLRTGHHSVLGITCVRARARARARAVTAKLFNRCGMDELTRKPA